MLYFVIERFKNPAAAVAVYQRFAERGRMLPEGLIYLDSWVEKDLNRCFQLMETNDPKLFDEWISNWSDLVEFEVIEVMKCAAAAAEVLGTQEKNN